MSKTHSQPNRLTHTMTNRSRVAADYERWPDKTGQYTLTIGTGLIFCQKARYRRAMGRDRFRAFGPFFRASSVCSCVSRMPKLTMASVHSTAHSADKGSFVRNNDSEGVTPLLVLLGNATANYATAVGMHASIGATGGIGPIDIALAAATGFDLRLSVARRSPRRRVLSPLPAAGRGEGRAIGDALSPIG
jgi:hypothetical protein